MIVEQLIFRLSYVPALDWLAPAVKFLPFTAGLQLVSAAGEASGGTAAEVGLFSRWPSGVVFAVFVAAAWPPRSRCSAAGTPERRRRDPGGQSRVRRTASAITYPVVEVQRLTPTTL